MSNDKSLTVPDTYFDSFWLTGCVTPRKAYQVSSLNSALFLSVDNLLGTHDILLELDDHPVNWPDTGLVAVSILVNRHGDYLLGTNGNVQPMECFQGLSHLPKSMVASPDTVVAVEQWLQSCPYLPLKEFAFQILGQPEIGGAFFSYPASQSHHHCFAGGLAQHSFEVAHTVYATSAGFTEHERWLAAIAGLLHDLGKVRTFCSNGRRTELGRLVSHEFMNLELVAPRLGILEKQWPDGANTLRYLFDWLLQPRQQRPVLPIALTVKQADIMSAAADSRKQAFMDKPNWCSFARLEGPGPASSYWLPKPP